MPARVSPIAVAGGLLITLAACSNQLTTQEATELLRAQFPADTVTWVATASWDSLMTELARQGLVTFSPGDFFRRTAPKLALTPAGSALGLRVLQDEKSTWYDRNLRLSGTLCALVLDSVGPITELTQGQTKVTQVHYTRRYQQHTPLFDKLSGTRFKPEQCDKTKVHEGTSVFFAEKQGWRMNRPPQFPDSTHVTTSRNFAYDNVGRLTGAVTNLEVAGPARDPDGDSITLRWVGRWYPGEGDKLEDMKLKTNGMKAEWQGFILMGEPAGGVIHLIASDRWGAADTVRVCMEGYSFGC